MLNHIPFMQLIPIDLQQILPAPDRLYASAGSFFIAGAIGGAYGLIGRVVYPHAGISPLNYAVWFCVAYQIKQCIDLLENFIENFLGLNSYWDHLEHVPGNALELEDRIRRHCWQFIHMKNKIVYIIDCIACKMFGLRPYQNIDSTNVEDASFLEMCRYRIWNVFKATVLETISSTLAHPLTDAMGFTLPTRTVVPLFIIVRSIMLGILIIPALHIYVRICDRLADQIGDGYSIAINRRVAWIKRFLPTL